MKKRIQVNKLSESNHKEILDNPLKIFPFIDERGISIFDSSLFLLLCIKVPVPRLEVRLFDDQDNYLDDYTRCLLKDRDDYEFHSFRKDEHAGIWELFLPPPVIGLGIKTRLRPGISSA